MNVTPLTNAKLIPIFLITIDFNRKAQEWRVALVDPNTDYEEPKFSESASKRTDAFKLVRDFGESAVFDSQEKAWNALPAMCEAAGIPPAFPKMLETKIGFGTVLNNFWETFNLYHLPKLSQKADLQEAFNETALVIDLYIKSRANYNKFLSDQRKALLQKAEAALNGDPAANSAEQ